MAELTFITSHPIKAQQIARYLDVPFDHQKLDLEEIQSLEVREVAREKAKAAYALIRKPVLVEDYSFIIHAWGRLPGPLIKWFLNEWTPAGICDRLVDDRTATAQSAFGYCDGERTEVFFAEINGTIADRPRGTEAWGTDAIFIPEGTTKTWSEMSDEGNDDISIRRIAIGELKKFLATI